MSAPFAINFRREAYLKEVARARRRVVSLGLWLTYFGLIGVLFGLYGLNCASLAARTRALERQVARLAQTRSAGTTWQPGRAEAAEVEQRVVDLRQWRDRLTRLAVILPAHARLTNLQFNPEGQSGGESKLVLTGRMRPAPGIDEVQGVMAFVTALGADSVFSRSYRNVRLVATRALTEAAGGTEFIVECR